MNSLARFTAVGVLLFSAIPGRSVENAPRQRYFDIRSDGAAASQEKVAALRKARGKSATSARAAGASMAGGQSKLATEVPGVKVDVNPVTKAPEVVDATLAGRTLTGPAAGKPEAVVRGFVSGNAALFGLTKAQAGALETKADYTNPKGNLSWVELQQTLNGIPVFQGTIRAAVRADGALVRTTGNLAGGLDATKLPKAPTLTASRAVVAAAASLGIKTDAASVAQKSVSDDGKKWTLAQGPFVRETQAELVYFPVEPGVAALAYSLVLWEKDDAWYALVDAQTGALLWRKNITDHQTQTATYSVYDDDSPLPLSPTNATPGSGIQGAPIARTTFTLISENPADNNGWIADTGLGVNAVTTGNNVDAGLDLDATNGIDATGRATGVGRVFNFSYIPGGQPGGQAPTGTAYRMGVVTNLFFWTNRYHDRLYDYGFTESARNFQTQNFGRGGAGSDAVSAEAQDSSGTNNANFSTPPDGTPGRMQMYIFDQPSPQRDGDLDQEVVLHELTHGLSNRLHGNGGGLNTLQSGGMGEGWSDFYGRCLLATAGEDVNGVYAMGAYVTRSFFGLGTDNSYYGIRRFPYAVKTNVGGNGKPHNPLTLADVDPGKISLTDGAFQMSPIGSTAALEVHNIGEVWCMALLEVRARIITRLGFVAGTDRVLQIVTDAMKLDPIDPTILQARNSIVAADVAGFGGADVDDIWAGFAAVGMGFNASITDPATTPNLPASVVESYIAPNLILGSVTFTDLNPTANGDGFADPGETIDLKVPVTNLNALGKGTATGVMVSVAGGAAVNYGSINQNTTVDNTTLTLPISYTIPPGTPAGTRLKISVAIDSSFGPVGPATPSFFLTVGQPVNGFTQNFDALSGTALPVGWSTSRTGSGTAWVTNTTNPDTPTRSAFSPNVGSTGSATMTTSAMSITSPSAQLTFRTAYNMEIYAGTYFFDGMVLEMSVNGGAFQDIVEAGGEFLAGGYNVTLESGSPIGGRNAWGGLSGGTTATPGYVTSRVLLPASVNGKSVRFRWIVGCDSTATAPGAAGCRIDSVAVSNGAIIGPINHPPQIGNQTFSVLEHTTGPIAGGVVIASDPDAGQTLSFAINPANPNFSINSSTGQLSVVGDLEHDTTPQVDLTVQATDNAPSPRSSSATITIRIRGSVPPMITGQGAVATMEDTARALVLGDLTVSDPDSVFPDEFTLTVMDGTNFTHTGNTITPAQDFFGTLSVPVRVNDGFFDDTNAPIFNLQVTVTAVNDAPSFTAGPDQAITSDGQPRMVMNWATAIVPGPQNEIDPPQSQSVTFTVTTSDDSFFSSLPTVSPTGTLAFTGAVGRLGTVMVTVVAHDDGGMANGGVDASAGQTFTITSTPATNDPPTFFVGLDQAAALDAGPQIVANFVTDISPGPPDESAQTVTFMVVADTPSLFSVQPAISPGGTLTYTPNPAASGRAVVTVIATDNGPSGVGDDPTSDPQTFAITVTKFAGHEGLYNGLAMPALGTTLSADKTGLFAMKVMETGSFSGKLVLGSQKFPLTGAIDNAGAVFFGKDLKPRLQLDREGLPPLFLVMQLDVAGTTGQITGTISEDMGPPIATVLLDKAHYSKEVPPPFKGKFTVIFQKPVSATLGAAAIPQGEGFGSLEVSEKGVAKLTGYLADNTPKFTYSNAISKDDFWPLWVPLAKGKGALAGRVQFRVVPNISDLDGQNLLWFKPPDPKGKFYSTGWPKGITTTLIGSTYVPADAVAMTFDSLLDPLAVHNANMFLSARNLSVTLKKVLRLEGKKVTCPLDSQVAVSVTLNNGLFKGHFFHPPAQEKVPLQGAIFQKQKMGFGFFHSLGETGEVLIDP